MMDLVDFIFAGNDESMGSQEGGKQITFADFVELLLQLRGTNNATVKDIVDLRKFVHNEITKMQEKVMEKDYFSRRSNRTSVLPDLERLGKKDFISGSSLEADIERVGKKDLIAGSSLEARMERLEE